MGAPDLLAKEVFAEEIPRLFGSSLTWQTGLELGLSELRLDGLLTVHPSERLAPLPPPWCHLRPGLVAVEVKMPGDHLDRRALSRALLRRQALEVTRLEQEPPDELPVALWMVAPHVPEWLTRMHQLQEQGAGCYRLETGILPVWWLAANELPLHDALLPLLVARSGKKLLELLRWSIRRQPAGWVTRMLERVSMSPEQIREMEAELAAYNVKVETAEEQAAAERAARFMLQMVPSVGEQLRREGLRDGRSEGLRDGQTEGLRTTVLDLCEAFGVSVTSEQRAQLATLALVELEALRLHLKKHRAWPV